MVLNTQPNLREPGKRYFQAYSPGDDFYEALIDTHQGLSDEQSAAVNTPDPAAVQPCRRHRRTARGDGNRPQTLQQLIH